MIRASQTFERFLHGFRCETRARYLQFESALAGAFYWHLRALVARRQLELATRGQSEAEGPRYEQLYEQWNHFDTVVLFGKAFGKEGLRNIQALHDSGIPTPVIRNWVVHGHIDQNGLFVDKDHPLKAVVTRVLGWTWHGLTLITVTLFLTYAWALDGPAFRKLAASILVISVFGVLATLMNSRSLSALPPSRDIRERSLG